VLELDGIRAVAILAVIACHYYPFSAMLFQAPEFGWAGVELFFVLSGFLITGILLQLKTGTHPYKVFYVRRILRIFPPYYAVMLLTYLIAWLQHDHLTRQGVAARALFLQSFFYEPGVLGRMLHAFSGGHLPNLFAITALPQGTDGFPISGFLESFGPTWSLSIEEWFYILWAPLVLHLRRKTLGLVCVAVCIGALCIRWLGFIGVYTYFDFFSRIDVLLIGALLALWMDHRRFLSWPAKKRGDAFLLAVSAICGVLLVSILIAIRPVLGREIRESPMFTVFGLPLLAFSFAGLLSYAVSHAGSGNILSRFLRLRPLVAVGTVSYTLYLIHVPIYFLTHQAAALMGIALASPGAALLAAVISTTVSVGVAFLSFRYFE